MASIIHMPKRKVIKPPSATAVKEHVAAVDEPAMETTMMEAIAIRKWISFAMADIHYQLSMVAKDKMISKRSFEESKFTALAISSYLAGVAADIDDRLKDNPPIDVPTSDSI